VYVDLASQPVFRASTLGQRLDPDSTRRRDELSSLCQDIALLCYDLERSLQPALPSSEALYGRKKAKFVPPLSFSSGFLKWLKTSFFFFFFFLLQCAFHCASEGNFSEYSTRGGHESRQGGCPCREIDHAKISSRISFFFALMGENVARPGCPYFFH